MGFAKQPPSQVAGADLQEPVAEWWQEQPLAQARPAQALAARLEGEPDLRLFCHARQ